MNTSEPDVQMTRRRIVLSAVLWASLFILPSVIFGGDVLGGPLIAVIAVIYWSRWAVLKWPKRANRKTLTRKRILAATAVMVAGWFGVTALVDRVIYGISFGSDEASDGGSVIFVFGLFVSIWWAVARWPRRKSGMHRWLYRSFWRKDDGTQTQLRRWLWGKESAATVQRPSGEQ